MQGWRHGPWVAIFSTMSLKAILRESLNKVHAGDWQGAHALIDHLDHTLACWLHASLHRQEGDRGNAAYWYGRANRSFCEDRFTDERARIASAVAALEDSAS